MCSFFLNHTAGQQNVSVGTMPILVGTYQNALNSAITVSLVVFYQMISHIFPNVKELYDQRNNALTMVK